MESNRKAIEGRSSAPCSADEAHRHLYHPWWSVKEMEAIATLAHRHHMNPVELIRDAVGGWDQAWQIRHSARYILEDANPEKLAEACGLQLGVITAALKTILPNAKSAATGGERKDYE
jgi:hypothetical protein